MIMRKRLILIPNLGQEHVKNQRQASLSCLRGRDVSKEVYEITICLPVNVITIVTITTINTTISIQTILTILIIIAIVCLRGRVLNKEEIIVLS